MKLPTSSVVPQYVLSATTQSKLVDIYNEMVNVHNGDVWFNQDDCAACVIGNMLRSGGVLDDAGEMHITQSTASIGFITAVSSIGLPAHGRLSAVRGTVPSYLFQSNSLIYEAAVLLRLPIGVKGMDYPDPSVNGEMQLTALDACVRIAAVLDISGYDIDKLQDLPQIACPH